MVSALGLLRLDADRPHHARLGITVKSADYVVAARALGAGTSRILIRHVLPNAVAPVIVVATISLGTFISTEATLSFLGSACPPPSRGVSTSAPDHAIRVAVHPVLPSLFCHHGPRFILLGEAVRDALDPKLR